MKKNTLLIVIAAAVTIAAVAYIAGSVNKDRDRVAAENTNTANVQNILHTVDNPSLTLETPEGFAVCPQSYEEIYGPVAYIWSDNTCDHGGDAIDIQMFVFDDQGIDTETILRDQGKIFFEVYEGQPDIQSSIENGREIKSVKLGMAYLVVEKIDNKVVYIQSAIDGVGREKNENATDIIAETISFIRP